MTFIQNTSLRFRLIVILSFSVLLLWVFATGIAWFNARKEISEVFDAQQILLAKRLASSDLRQILIERNKRGGFREHHKRHHPKYDDDALAFAIFTRSGQMIVSDDAEGANFIFAPQKGFSMAYPAGDDDLWRLFWLPSEDGHLIIAVGQELEYRDDAINKIVFSQMIIWIAGLPFLIALIIFIISKELRVLQRLSQDMLQRSPEDHHLLPTKSVPTEILPLVNSLNGFFDRTSTMLLRERRFTSDAAHELRSPLAALRIQTEVAQLADDDPQMRADALANLTQGIDRATQLIEQLLTLSRLDNLQELDDLQHIDWTQLISSLIGELYFNVQKRQMDLQFEPLSTPASSQGQPLLLSLMLRNLIDNAIRYCPEGSTIKVTLTQHYLSVEDNGGGVADENLAKLGQRFYRPAGQNEKGSGLGLSIVHRIAALHHYQLRLENIKNQQGERLGLNAIISF